jgi:hypothetical protein
MGPLGRSGGSTGGGDPRRAVLNMTIGIWSSTVLVAGILVYSLGVRRHHIAFGLVIGGVYLVVVGATNALYLRRFRRQLAERSGGRTGLRP